MDSAIHVAASTVVALVVLGLLIVAVAAMTMMPSRKRFALTSNSKPRPPRETVAEFRGFLMTLSATLRASEGAAPPRADPSQDALDETRRRVALVVAPSCLHDVDSNANHSPQKQTGKMSNQTFDRIHTMIREGHSLLEQGRVREGAKLFIDASEAAEQAAAADLTDARPHWLLAFAWFGLANAAEQGKDMFTSTLSYRRAFFRMAKACERQLLQAKT